MELFLSNILVVLAIAMLVAIAARLMRLPYTVGLVLVGIGFAFLPVDRQTTLTHDFIFDVILPPLLFEAAISIRWKELRRDMAPVLVLSTLGTILAAAVVAIGLVLILHWPAPSAALFGVLIAATDPVAVIAMFKDNGVHGRVRLLVECESLFNDGVAAVLFAIALSFATAGGGGGSVSGAAVSFVVIAFGGIVLGLVCGALAILVAGRTSDHLVEAALTTVVAYGSFLLAEHLHVSGVLATVAAGLLMGNLGLLRADERRNVLSTRGREFVLAFWEFAAFIANSVIFPLIGLNVAAVHFREFGALALAIVIGLVLLSRALTVYPLSLVFIASSRRLDARTQHVLWWGGLRGALALALALALPSDLPLRDEIVVAAFGVVAFSVVVQGLTMPLLLRKLGFLPRSGQPAGHGTEA